MPLQKGSGTVLIWAEPFFFLKPTSSYISPGEGPVEVPKGVVMHHEGMCRFNQESVGADE